MHQCVDEEADEAFHRGAIVELRRVAAEVRIFPLLALGARPSTHIEPVAEAARRLGHRVEIERVDYQFQRGGNQMMRVLAH